MSGKTILITGGGGFIGSNLTDHLLRRGAKVTVLDDFSRGNPGNLRPYHSHPHFHLERGSVLNNAGVDRLTHDVDYVFHLAAQVHWEESIDDPQASFEVNSMGTLNVLEAVRRSSARRNPVELLVYASSSEVYGTAQSVPMDENHPLNPQSPYAAGKVAGDRLCLAYHHVYGIPVVIVRQFNTYGPGQPFFGSYKGYSAVIPKFVDQVLSGAPPTIYGDGEQTKDFHYISDLLRGYDLVLDNHERLVGQAMNLGTGRETSINKLANMIIETVGTKLKKPNLTATLKPVHLPARPGEVRRFVADIGLAKKTMGFEPQISLREGLEKFVDWFVNEGRHHSQL